jgi:hypothetical protein
VAKGTGLAWTTFGVGDSGNSVQDIRNDCTSLQFAMPRGVQDVTGLDKSAIERLLLLADFSLTPTGVVNTTATTSEHAVFRTVPSSSVLRTVNITMTGSVAANLNQSAAILFTDYQWSRSQAGELIWTAPGVLGSGAVPAWS